MAVRYGQKFPFLECHCLASRGFAEWCQTAIPRRKFLPMIDMFSCRPPFIYFIGPFKEDSLSLELWVARTGMRRNVGINVAHNEYFFAWCGSIAWRAQISHMTWSGFLVLYGRGGVRRKFLLLVKKWRISHVTWSGVLVLYGRGGVRRKFLLLVKNGG